MEELLVNEMEETTVEGIEVLDNETEETNEGLGYLVVGAIGAGIGAGIIAIHNKIKNKKADEPKAKKPKKKFHIGFVEVEEPEAEVAPEVETEESK